MILIDDNGLRSGRAADFLKRHKYHVKILIGGLESLEGLIELEYGKMF